MSWFWEKKEEIRPPKPDDLVEYHIGFSCDQGHCHWIQGQGEDKNDFVGQELVCYKCGNRAIPSVVKSTREYVWGNYRWARYAPEWHPSLLGTDEFVRYLDKDTRLSDETISSLKERAARDLTRVVPPEEIGTYSMGLQDGETMAAQYVLGAIQEESK
jgi:hypothetical protein